MKEFTLKQILEKENVQIGIKTNLFTTNEEMTNAVNKTLKLTKCNNTSVEALRDGIKVKFENTLYKDEYKSIYLLESRLFYVKTDSMFNAYLEVINSNGTILEDYIDDVWTYADWKKISK